jgi:glycosyltransferase involved in cell wall biosynthesis
VRRELGLAADQPLVTQVSIREWKGWRDLLAAVARLGGAFGRARLLFVGCEPTSARTRVVSEARRLGIDRAVLTLGYRRDMPEVLAASDVVVDASWAGTGITGTVREAMAMARAVVASDCAGNRELVEHGVGGLVVAPRDPRALAKAIGSLLADRSERRRLGAAARQRVVQSFSTEVRLDRLEALYQAVRPA